MKIIMEYVKKFFLWKWSLPIAVVVLLILVPLFGAITEWQKHGLPFKFSSFLVAVSLTREKADISGTPVYGESNQKAAVGPTAPAVTPKKSQSAPSSTARSLSPFQEGQRETAVYPAGVSGAVSGPPDLAIEIVDTGILNGDTFVHATSVQRYERAAIVFDVKNVGGETTPPWNFSAQLPISFNGNFTSGVQQALAPGEYIRFTIGFDNLINSATNTISFTVDPENKVNDSNRINNSATATIYRNY